MRAADLQRQLAQTNSGIERVSASLEVLTAEVHHNERKLAWNQVQLRAAQTTLARHDDALKRRLIDVYERGDVGYANVLFSATSFSDFAERWDDIGYLIAANQRTIRQRRAAEQGVAGAERALEGERAILEGSLGREQQARFQLAALADQRSMLVSAADAQRRSVASEVAQLEDLSAAEESALEQLIRERQRIEEERRQAAALARRRAALLAGREAPSEAPEGAPGAFSWPVSGPISSPFGMREDPLARGWLRQRHHHRPWRPDLDPLRAPFADFRRQRAGRSARPSDRRGGLHRQLHRPPPSFRGSCQRGPGRPDDPPSLAIGRRAAPHPSLTARPQHPSAAQRSSLESRLEADTGRNRRAVRRSPRTTTAGAADPRRIARARENRRVFV